MRSKSGQKGVAAIEFALIAPVVLVVLFGILEFGFALWRKQSLTSAVRDGARQAIVNPIVPKDTAWVRTEVKANVAGLGLDPTLAVVDCAGCPCPNPSVADHEIVVTVSYPTQFLVLSALQYGGGMASTISLDAQIVMQCE